MTRMTLPHGFSLDFGVATHVMAVINLSPESKNRHSIVGSPREALDRALRFRQLGATLFDLGGQSSHYENPTISAAEEIARIGPAVELLAGEGLLVSVDTWKAPVAEACLEAGAVIVNDTGGLGDATMRSVIAAHRAGAVVLYVEGAHPHDVQEVEILDDKAEVTSQRLRRRLTQLEAEGIHQTIVDPGIAINYRGDYLAYTRMQLEVIRGSEALRSLGRPVLLPIPRKQEDHRVAAYITLALEHGADMIRVHDVEMACDLVDLFDRSAR